MSKARPRGRGGAPEKQQSPYHVLGILLLVAVAVALLLAGKGLLNREVEEPASAVNPSDPPEVQLAQALAEKRVVFVLFGSTTCFYCREMKKATAEVLPEFEGRLVFIDVNVYDEGSRNLIRQMQLRAIPTSYIYDRSGEAQMYQGAIPASILREELQAALSR